MSLKTQLASKNSSCSCEQQELMGLWLMSGGGSQNRRGLSSMIGVPTGACFS
uniref:Uncharacterized protein n=1 Tax=Lotus japonicus TaxID=34305 RepID=I3SB94_LOTJA|nr:unknown [Lotus japonicus]